MVLDSGAGESFIRKDIISPAILRTMKRDHLQTDIRDASIRRVRVRGTAKIVARLG